MNKARQARAATARPNQHTIVVYRGSPEYAEWLTELAEHLRIPETSVVDVSLARLAQAESFRPPPRRLARHQG